MEKNKKNIKRKLVNAIAYVLWIIVLSMVTAIVTTLLATGSAML